MGTVHADMHIDKFADFLFLRNVHDKKVELSLGGVQNQKDFFFFLLDLFCKGLILLHGDDRRVIIENLTMDDFGLVKKKMYLAGIDVHLDVHPREVDVSQDKPCELNLQDLESKDDNLDLKSYVFTVKTMQLVINVKFSIFHNV